MKILDYGCGPRDDAIDRWTEGEGIDVLRRIIGEQVGGILEIHAFDPLEEIMPNEIFEDGRVSIHFHTIVTSLPEQFDCVCAIYPNPVVQFSRSSVYIDNWDCQHSKYTPGLISILDTGLTVGGFCIVQFDREWEVLHGVSAGEKYIDYLKENADSRDSELSVIPHKDSTIGFYSCGCDFESITALKKVGKDLQKALLTLYSPS